MLPSVSFDLIWKLGMFWSNGYNFLPYSLSCLYVFIQHACSLISLYLSLFFLPDKSCGIGLKRARVKHIEPAFIMVIGRHSFEKMSVPKSWVRLSSHLVVPYTHNVIENSSWNRKDSKMKIFSLFTKASAFTRKSLANFCHWQLLALWTLTFLRTIIWFCCKLLWLTHFSIVSCSEALNLISSICSFLYLLMWVPYVFWLALALLQFYLNALFLMFLAQEKTLKELFEDIPTFDELHSLELEGLRADIILVDTEKDKKLSMLKQLIVALVKGLSSNPAAIIKKIAGLVSFTFFYFAVP